MVPLNPQSGPSVSTAYTPYRLTLVPWSLLRDKCVPGVVSPETRDAAQHPTMHRAGPTTDSDLALNVSTSELE